MAVQAALKSPAFPGPTLCTLNPTLIAFFLIYNVCHLTQSLNYPEVTLDHINRYTGSHKSFLISG